MPALTARVIDQTGTLNDAQRAALEAKLAAFEQTAGAQIVVLMVPTTQPEDIAAYAFRVADTWKIGRREVGDGLLLVVAKNDRQLRIEVAKALEGAVPDLAARQIIDRAITPGLPRRRLCRRAECRRRCADRAHQGRRPAAARSAPRRRRGDGGAWQELLMFFFVAVPVIGGILSKAMGRKLGALVTAGGTGAVAWFISASLWIAGVAALVSLLVVGVLGVGALSGLARGTGRGGRGGPGGWGGGAAWRRWRRLRRRRRLRLGRRWQLRRRRRVGPVVMNRLLRILKHRWLDDERCQARARRRGAAAAGRARAGQRGAAQRRDPAVHRGRPAAVVPVARCRRRASARSRCSASCACGTPSTTTAC